MAKVTEQPKYAKGCTNCPYSGHSELKECPDAYTYKAALCNLYDDTVPHTTKKLEEEDDEI